MKVRSMMSNNGNAIANQFIIEDDNKRVFQSYSSKIAEYDLNTRELKVFSDWDYSKTTLKYFKIFIDEETIYTYGTKAKFIKEYEGHVKVKFIV